MKQIKTYTVYLYLISMFGLIIVGWGVYELPNLTPLPIFLVLLVLAAASHLMTTTVTISEKTSITFEVSTAVSMAAIPLYGPFAAAVVITIANLSIWALKNADKDWKKSWKQLSFNIGMSNIAIFLAGVVFKLMQDWLGADTFFGFTLPWFLAAIVNDQLNIWLLIGVIRLQHGAQMKPLEFWLENRWAMPINIAVMSIGGGVLAFATARYDLTGVIIFFLPISLSAYAFRLYVRQMQAHMKNLESIVAERTKELADLMVEKDQFLTVLTHDMKSPLTSINIYASLIRDHPQLVTEKPHMADVILRSQKTLTEIVNNILDLEKLQSDGSFPLDKEKLDLISLIEASVEPLKAQASQKQIDLQYSVDEAPIPVLVDRHQMQRVIQNLISNAIKYTPQDGHVSVMTYTKDHAVITQVQDDGYGIPTEDLPHVFDRYRRVSKHKNIAAGTGLGLAISKAIVEAHGGTISVASEESVGSTFAIQLPSGLIV